MAHSDPRSPAGRIPVRHGAAAGVGWAAAPGGVRPYPHRGPSGPVLLLGIDPFSERPFRENEFSHATGLSDTASTDLLTRRDAVLVSRPLASRLGLEVGDALAVMVGPRQQALRVAGIFTSRSGLYPLDGAVLLMDIGPAQELLDRVGGLDYIDVIGAGPPAEVQKHLLAALPPGVEVVRPAAPGEPHRGPGGLLSP